MDTDRIVITGPQFDRIDGNPVTYCPSTFEEFDALPNMPIDAIKALGCQRWDKNEEGATLWLYPAEWYTRIPSGLKVVDINWETEVFEPGVTDDDKRFGALAFGFMRFDMCPPEPTPQDSDT